MRNDRWSTYTEIKQVLQSGSDKSKGGPVLYCKNGSHWKYTGEGHAIFLGVSGSGKSRRGTIPMTRGFIETEESFVILDPKGEIYAATAPYLNNRYDLHVIDFRSIFRSECVNLLSAPAELFRSGDPEKKQIALEMVDNLAHTLYPVITNTDPFWQESARSLFVATVYALLENAKDEQINMASVYQFIVKGEERYGGPSNAYLNEFVQSLPEDSISAMLLQSYISCAAAETRSGIRSSFLEGLSMFARSEGLMSMMSADDLHINQLDGETPTAIYIILPDESPVYDSICTILITQLMGHYIRLAHDKYNGRLPRRMNFLVEEAGNVGRIGALGHLLSAGRSRNVRCQLVLQNQAQLDMLYGQAEATTIRSNADVLIAFRTNHWNTLSELSAKCGERTMENNGHISREPLISPSQLAAMRTGQALVMISGSTKYISWIPDYTEIFDCSKRTLPKRESTMRQKPVTFDIKEYVKNYKKQQMDRISRSDTIEQSSFESKQTPHITDTNKSILDTGILSDSSINDMSAKIDAQIASLEAAENEKTHNGGFSFVLKSVGKTKGKLIKAIRDYSNIPSLKKAMEVIESLPYTFTFHSKAEADKAKTAICEAGGIVCSIEDITENSNSHGKYNVIIIDDGGSRIKVTKALCDAIDMDIRDAIECVKNLPYTLQFTNIGEAKKVAESIKKAGAKVIFYDYDL